jgi:hypothetical protein
MLSWKELVEASMVKATRSKFVALLAIAALSWDGPAYAAGSQSDGGGDKATPANIELTEDDAELKKAADGLYGPEKDLAKKIILRLATKVITHALGCGGFRR